MVGGFEDDPDGDSNRATRRAWTRRAIGLLVIVGFIGAIYAMTQIALLFRDQNLSHLF